MYTFEHYHFLPSTIKRKGEKNIYTQSTLIKDLSNFLLTTDFVFHVKPGYVNHFFHLVKDMFRNGLSVSFFFTLIDVFKTARHLSLMVMSLSGPNYLLPKLYSSIFWLGFVSKWVEIKSWFLFNHSTISVNSNFLLANHPFIANLFMLCFINESKIIKTIFTSKFPGF